MVIKSFGGLEEFPVSSAYNKWFGTTAVLHSTFISWIYMEYNILMNCCLQILTV
jgi:hypothetical protein